MVIDEVIYPSCNVPTRVNGLSRALSLPTPGVKYEIRRDFLGDFLNNASKRFHAIAGHSPEQIFTFFQFAIKISSHEVVWTEKICKIAWVHVAIEASASYYYSCQIHGRVRHSDHSRWSFPSQLSPLSLRHWLLVLIVYTECLKKNETEINRLLCRIYWI